MTENEEWSAIAALLLQWHGHAARVLPWRTWRSLYGTVLSEFMLRQTRVVTAIPYYLRWMERFPDFRSVAEADEKELLCLWSGLGYYGRVRQLRQLSIAICDSEFPPVSPDEWQKFPGVGPYCAAAIAAIGQKYDVIALDGNGIRILCRLGGTGPFPSRSAAERALRPAADALAIPGRCDRICEALMDLGSGHCRARRPHCAACPLRSRCAVVQRRLVPEDFPKFPAPKCGKEERRRLWLRDDRGLWLTIGSGSRLSGLYELPILPVGMGVGPVLRTIRRRISSINYIETVHCADGRPGELLAALRSDGQEVHPCSCRELERLPISGPHGRCIADILANG
ncbi:MAG: hypothetical protein LBH53_01805 [Puniceicoccales bacterium]|jgi:A/G-specific adenine glycosylase|nr:hypothetical protein [Puniceicoccales bacterium]